MNRISRNTTALCMSFVLLIFTICQAQAMSRVVLPAADTAVPASVEMPAGCHELALAQDADVPDCHAECQHVHQADIAKKLPLPDVSTLAALFALPLLADLADAAALSQLPARGDPGDPDVVIRFQRFLE